MSHNFIIFCQAMQAEIASTRQRREQQLNLFFGEELNWDQESIEDLSVFKVTPVNYPASITTRVDRYFNEFSKQQAGGPVCYSDHSSISGGSLVPNVPRNVLDSSSMNLSLCLLPPCSLHFFWSTSSNQPSSLTTYVNSTS